MELDKNVMNSSELTYKILDAYREKKYDRVNGVFGLIGLAALLGGVIFDSTPLSIGGGSCVVSTTVGEGLEYMKAYFEARLDYLQNNKFTRI